MIVVLFKRVSFRKINRAIWCLLFLLHLVWYCSLHLNSLLQNLFPEGFLGLMSNLLLYSRNSVRITSQPYASVYELL